VEQFHDPEHRLLTNNVILFRHQISPCSEHCLRG
jgi:hypothetical protein